MKSLKSIISFEINKLNDAMLAQMRIKFLHRNVWKRIFENLSLKIQLATKAVTYVVASLGSVDSSLVKSWSPGIGWGHNAGSIVYIGCIRKIFDMILSQTYWPEKTVSCVEAFFNIVGSSLFRTIYIWNLVTTIPSV